MGLTMFESTGLFLGWIICTYIIVQITLGIHDALKEYNAELHKQLLKHLDSIIHLVEVEKVGTTYYWYDKNNRTFLAQGSTDDEIINGLKARFPDHIFYLPTNHFISAKHNWVPTLAPRHLPNKIDSIIQK